MRIFYSHFLILFWFSIYKMVDNMDIYKSLNINIGTVMRNPEMLKFVLDHFKGDLRPKTHPCFITCFNNFMGK